MKTHRSRCEMVMVALAAMVVVGLAWNALWAQAPKPAKGAQEALEEAYNEIRQTRCFRFDGANATLHLYTDETRNGVMLNPVAVRCDGQGKVQSLVLAREAKLSFDGPNLCMILRGDVTQRWSNGTNVYCENLLIPIPDGR
jgi:hypothetical protein